MARRVPLLLRLTAGLALAVYLALVAAAQPGPWLPLAEDGLHDPDNPALKLLQQPADALAVLPPDTAGNHVRWVQAIGNGYITPRSGVSQDKPVQILDSDIIMNKRGGATPLVVFPHARHTQWLSCGNCHDKLFKSKAGATPVTMRAILEGEYCGVCHGAVSFPLTECSRCHSLERGQYESSRP